MGVRNSTTLEFLEKKNNRSTSSSQSDKKIVQLPTGQVETHVRKLSYDEQVENVIFFYN